MAEQRTQTQQAREAQETENAAREREVVAAPEERVEPTGPYGATDTRALDESPDRVARTGADAHSNAALFSETDAGALSQQWESIQAGFVDEPRHAVERADQLVSETIGRLTETFSQERSRLEQQWSQGDAASTEDLRVALQRYRSFFQRLLSA